MALSLPDVLYALSDPLRLRIVRQLADEGDAPCGAFEARMPKSSLSHHFKVLRDAGVISTRNEGVRRINALRRKELDAALPGLLDAILGAPRPRAKPRRRKATVSET
ncbi:MAG: transcriptional regulator [Acidobacteria bacterium]|nr:transcriptional regulator [Acidobacteriota bacterium]